MKQWTIALAAAAALSAGPAAGVPAQGTSANTLDIHVIDVEGGQATLLVSPSREAMLVDAGWSGFDGRDADRIASVVKKAGLSQIDYLVVTHYHRDHVGGVPELVKRVPVRTFVDHGPTVETGDLPAALYNAYVEARKTGRHLEVRPGDVIPITGLNVRVVSANGRVAVDGDGTGSPNPLCAAFKSRDPDPGENARSVGTVIEHGRFRMLDLGDLTWNTEHLLACPNNQLGAIDLYLTTHHGTETSGPPALVHAIRPRAAVMNNGANKGASKAAWRIVRDAPGLGDLWQLHYAVAGGADHNVPAPFIANVDETTAHNIRISARPDGSFTITNERNGHTKQYAARR